MKTYLELREITAMEKVAGNLRDRLLIRLLFHLGCRVSEALALTVTDIDFAAGTVSIRHLKSRLELSCPNCGARLGVTHVFCPKCGVKIEERVAKEKKFRRQRVLPVDAGTLEAIKQYIQRGGPVLRNGKREIFGINRHRAWQIIRECVERARLPDLVNPETGKRRGISPHRLRDSFSVRAVKLDDSGDGLRLLQEHLGHANFNTTARYRKISGREHKDWYQKLWKQE